VTGAVHEDSMLRFGLRSAPKFFNAVADTFHWHLLRLGIGNIFHYLDDYIIVEPPDSPLFQVWQDIQDRKCRISQVAIVPYKREGSTTCLAFLETRLTP